MNNEAICNFKRNKEIEKEIDKKIFMNTLNCDSVTIFFDNLDELIYANNIHLDRYSKYRIQDIIKYKKLEVEKIGTYHNRLFNKEELIYIEEIKRYLNNLREKNPIRNSNFINYLISIFEKEYISSLKNISFSINIVKKQIEYYQYPHISCFIDNGNFILFDKLHHRQAFFISDFSTIELENEHFRKSLIFLKNVPYDADKIKTIFNIEMISFITERDKFESIIFDLTLMNIINMLRNGISKINRKVNSNVSEQKNNHVVIELLDKALKYTVSINEEYRFSNLKFKSKDYIASLKYIKNKVRTVIEIIENSSGQLSEVTGCLLSISLTLRTEINNIEKNHHLNSNVEFSLSEIKRNNTLYILSKNNKKNEDFAFGEENLSSILASNLRCLYRNSGIIIHCESLVGNGRSDIKISRGNNTLGIVESKLIRGNSEIKNEVLNGIDQLHERYSENDSLNAGLNIHLHLIIFTYDKNFRDIAIAIKSAIEIYSKRNSLYYIPLNSSENTLNFSYTERRFDSGFLDKERLFSVHVCNMEIDYKKMSAQRTKKSEYDPTRSR
ncbi:hypothetical protein WCU61_05155 [Pectobacterium versatile]|uniref:hypothetical protein n=1 Tax=Pectobacterium versatile TaxID=2488639 RepID=UPI003015AB90